MSETPRTDDAMTWSSDMGRLVVNAEITQKIESELAEARAEIEAIVFVKKKAIEEIAFLNQEIESKDKLTEQMRQALQWYKEQVSNCNRNGDIGETARDRLAKDVGKRAETALSAAERSNT